MKVKKTFVRFLSRNCPIPAHFTRFTEQTFYVHVNNDKQILHVNNNNKKNQFLGAK